MKLNAVPAGAALLVLAAILARSAHSQVLMSNGTYSQSFDSLANVGTDIAWTNNVTLPGWFASKSVAPTEITNYDTGTGLSTAGSLYSFGSSGSTERTLGSLASGTPGNIAYGLRCLNDTGFDRTNLTVSYTGEQWRAGNSNVQKLAFSYHIGASLTNADARNSQSWTAFPALDFSSPNTNSTQALDGSDPTNRVTFANIVLSGVRVPAGLELFLRWFDTNDAGSDDGMGVDDLTVSFGQAVTNTTPPPGTNTAFSVLTYNVHGNSVTNWSTNSLQVQAIARQMQYLQPDIITFQEIPMSLAYEMTNFAAAYLPGRFLLQQSHRRRLDSLQHCQPIPHRPRQELAEQR